MNQAIKNEWVKALRSGEYSQTENALHRTVASEIRPAGFCCLGVLCELAVSDGVIEKSFSRTDIATYDGEYTGFLPQKVVTWSGIDLDLGSDSGVSFTLYQIEDLLDADELEKVRNVSTRSLSVADLNDSGVSFGTIANVIERLF